MILLAGDITFSGGISKLAANRTFALRLVHGLPMVQTLVRFNHSNHWYQWCWIYYIIWNGTCRRTNWYSKHCWNYFIRKHSSNGTVTANSDAKLKKNVATVSNALDKVNLLRGVEFDYIANDKHSIGVIAQEVEAVLPDLVEGDETKSVAYGNLTAVLIEAVKELTAEVNTLKAELNTLKGE